MVLVTKTSDQPRQRGRVCVCVCVCVCVFTELHITAQSGLITYSFYATVCNPLGGYVSRSYSWLETRMHSATTSLLTTTAFGRNPTPSTSTTTLCPEKIIGTKIWELWTGLFPSHTWVKLVARRLVQQVETGIRQKRSTSAGAPCNLRIQTQQSRLPYHIKPCNVVQQWCRHSAPFPFQHPIGACPDYTRTSFLPA